MNKNNLLSILFTLGAFMFTNSYAQVLKQKDNFNFTSYQKYHLNDVESKTFLKDLQAYSKNSPKQTESTQSRLKGYSYSYYDGMQYIISDSMEFFWGDGLNNSNTILHNVLENSIDRGILYHPPNFDFNLYVGSYFETPMEFFVDLNYDSSTVFLNTNSGLIKSNYLLNYFSNDRKESTEVHIYNNDNDAIPFRRILKFYDNNGKLIEDRSLVYWNNIWEKEGTKIYEYNSNGAITLIINANWNVNNNDWVHTSEISAEYDNQNRLERKVLKELNNGNLENSERELYFYNSNGNLDSIQYQVWNNTYWRNFKKLSFGYNSENLTNKLREEVYVNNNWQNAFQRTFNYNSNGDCTEIIYEIYQDNSWNYLAKIEREYVSNTLAKVEIFEWSNDDNALKNYVRTFYESNSFNQFTKVYSEAWQNDEWKLTNEAPLYKFYYEEYEDPVSVDEIENNISSTIYPNPTKDRLTIEVKGGNLEKIRIVDMQGKVVYETQNPVQAKEVHLDISHLTSGMYYVILENEKGQTTKSVQKL